MSENDSNPAGSPGSMLDRAIDQAVRRLVQVDPPAGFRHRVHARLARPAARGFRGVRYLAFAGGLALLVLAVGLLRQGGPAKEIPVSPAPANLQVAREAAGREAAPPADASPRVSRPATEAAAGQPPVRRPAGRPRDAQSQVIPMPEIASVFGTPSDAVAGATVAGAEDAGPARTEGGPANQIEITRLTVAPLEIPPLRIAPIPAAQKQR